MSPGGGGIRASMARAIASLSRRPKQSAAKNDGAVWNGAGKNEAPITEALPPGSRKVSRSYQRILSATAVR